mgnify:CR=1 FL=1
MLFHKCAWTMEHVLQMALAMTVRLNRFAAPLCSGIYIDRYGPNTAIEASHALPADLPCTGKAYLPYGTASASLELHAQPLDSGR